MGKYSFRNTDGSLCRHRNTARVLLPYTTALKLLLTQQSYKLLVWLAYGYGVGKKIREKGPNDGPLFCAFELFFSALAMWGAWGYSYNRLGIVLMLSISNLLLGATSAIVPGLGKLPS
jgi:hypothetical protein